MTRAHRPEADPDPRRGAEPAVRCQLSTVNCQLLSTVLLDLDVHRPRPRLLRLRQRHGEDAVLRARLHLLGVEVRRELEAAVELAVAALDAAERLALALRLGLLLALDRQHVAGHG